MAKRKSISDADVADACARMAIYGALVPFVPTKASRAAVAAAIENGIIEHSGDIPRGWLTEKGIALLDKETADRYRAAVTQKQRITP
jgi:hypothetical protein